MFCDGCGTKLEDGVRICPKCGKTVTGGKETANAGGDNSKFFVSSNDTLVTSAGKKFVENLLDRQVVAGKKETANAGGDNSEFFVSPDETLIASLGNGFVENLLYRQVKSCKALLTNQRIYFQGRFFSGSGKSLLSEKAEKIVDIEDITGTGFRYTGSVMKKIIISILIPIIIAILYFVLDINIFFSSDNAPKLLVLEIFSIIYSVVTYLKGRTTYFMIEYAGGSICFNATIVGLADVRDFQKQIRRAKDAFRGK